jgi:cytochrome c-type biogenesis protein CcmH
MLLWLTFAVMTAAALAALLWPIYPPRRGRGWTTEAGLRDAELAVYRDQLAEIDRDVARGLIDPAEAQATRNEVSRRMLAAGRPRGPDAGFGAGPVIDPVPAAPPLSPPWSAFP